MTKNEDILKSLISSGILNAETVAQHEQMLKSKEKEETVLQKHTAPITQWGDGQWHTYVKVDGKRHHKHKKTREELIDYLFDWYSPKVTTMRTLYPEWLEYRKLEVDEETVKRNMTSWKYVEEIADIPIAELTTFKLKMWAMKLVKDMSLTAKAYHNIALLPRRILEFAVDKELIESNPYNGVKLGNRIYAPEIKKPDEEQVYTREEQKLLLKIIDEDAKEAGKKVYKLSPLAIKFMIFMGLRVGELAGLKFSDVVGHDLIINRHVKKDTHKVVAGAKTRAGSFRRIPIPNIAYGLIEEAKSYPHESDWIFSEYERPLSVKSVEDSMAKYNALLEVEKKRIEDPDAVPELTRNKNRKLVPKGVNRPPHCTRKNYISTLIDAGININTVRQYVGHADERTTLRNYVFDRSTSQEKRDQIEKAFAGGKWD